ncbi:MAG: phage tail length tape measure family protein, partial [Alphaproteobacteria bacterium]|nr:phage tail length tape measure family protein [Alphaproteobacteria bacterium]
AGQKHSRFGNIAQQAGYQVGDFAVQVAGGQNALVALTQQGSQMLGVFGPWGAVLGAAGAVAGALAVGMFGVGKNTKDAASAVDAYKAALKSARELTSTEAQNAHAMAEAKRAEAVERVQNAMAIEAENLARRHAAADLLQADAKRLRDEQQFLPGSATIEYMKEPLAKARGDIETTTKRIIELQGALDKLADPPKGSVLWDDLHSNLGRADDDWASVLKTVGGYRAELDRAADAQMRAAQSMLESLDPARAYAAEVARLTSLKPALVTLLGSEVAAQNALNQAIRNADPAYQDAKRQQEAYAREMEAADDLPDTVADEAQLMMKEAFS